MSTNFTFPLMNATYTTMEGLFAYPNTFSTPGLFGTLTIVFFFLVFFVSMIRNGVKSAGTTAGFIAWVVAVFSRMIVVDNVPVISDSVLTSVTVFYLMWLIILYFMERR